MFKRFLTALLVFPISFIIVGILTLTLMEMGSGFAPGGKHDFSTLVWDPQIIFNAAQSLDSAVHACLNLTLKGVTGEQVFAVIFALAGAVILSISCLSEHLHVMLLYARRAVTMPLVFGFAFLIFGALFNLVASWIDGIAAMTSSTNEEKANAIAQYHANYDGTANMIVIVAAALVALYLTLRLTRWDGLPWCRAPLPVRIHHRSRRAL